MEHILYTYIRIICHYSSPYDIRNVDPIVLLLIRHLDLAESLVLHNDPITGRVAVAQG